jgi:glycosyltransferase involved in cell wall biosynthesis
LSGKGNEVHFFFYSDVSETKSRPDTITLHAVSFKKNGSALFKMISFIKLLYLLTSTKCDIHIQRNAGFETGFIAFVCAIMRKKFVYMISHSIDCDGRYRKMFPVRGLLYEYGLKQAQAHIAQTEEQKKIFADHYKKSSFVLRSSYPIINFSGARKETSILWVGRIVSWKRPERIFEVASYLKDHKFVVIGPQNCDDHFYELFIQTLSTFSNIRYIERVDFHDIDTYFQQAQFLLNTSVYEGFPNTFIQAFKNRTPVLSNGVDPDSIIRKNGLGYVSDSCAEIARFVRTTTDDPGLYQELSEKCFKYANEYHNIDRNIELFSTFLEKV